MADLYNPDSDR
ncbi:hypothetical protein YPPY98_4122, partial [Yersinia pestis PY-98]